MKLIRYDNFELKVADEAFLIRPIRLLFEADKSKHKEDFFRQISYMYFMCDPRSTFMYITDTDERENEIKQQEGFPEDWKPSPMLEAAMAQYKKHVITSSSLLLNSLRICINNLRIFLEKVDLFQLDDKGKPLFQVSSITNAVKQSVELSKLLSNAEKELSKDYEEEDKKARGSTEKSMFEDE